MITDQGIVLRLTEYAESSQIVTLFTARTGQVRLIAKGARRSTAKRFAPGLDLLEFGEIRFVPARGDVQLGTLAEWAQRDSFGGLRRELARLYGGLYLAEAVAALTEENDPHPELFTAMVRRLGELAADAAPMDAIVAFQFDLLRAIGYAPNLQTCVRCGRRRSAGYGAYFSSLAGGLLCSRCLNEAAEKRRVRASLLDAEPCGPAAAGWFRLLNDHIEHVAGRALRSAPKIVLAASARDRHRPAAEMPNSPSPPAGL